MRAGAAFSLGSLSWQSPQGFCAVTFAGIFTCRTAGSSFVAWATSWQAAQATSASTWVPVREDVRGLLLRADVLDGLVAAAGAREGEEEDGDQGLHHRTSVFR